MCHRAVYKLRRKHKLYCQCGRKRLPHGTAGNKSFVVDKPTSKGYHCFVAVDNANATLYTRLCSLCTLYDTERQAWCHWYCWRETKKLYKTCLHQTYIKPYFHLHIDILKTWCTVASCKQLAGRVAFQENARSSSIQNFRKITMFIGNKYLYYLMST